MHTCAIATQRYCNKLQCKNKTSAKKLVKQKEVKACATVKRHYCNNINKPGATKNRHEP
jgi:hypothetical protein